MICSRLSSAATQGPLIPPPPLCVVFRHIICSLSLVLSTYKNIQDFTSHCLDTMDLFSSRNFLVLATVSFSFVFDKFYLIMD